MNVYIWTDNPIPVRISSDLRWATLAWLQAQWWDWIAYRFNTYRLDSTGLRSSTTSNDVAYLYKNIPTLSSNNIITIKVTWNVTKGSDYGANITTHITSTTTFPSSYSNSLSGRFYAWNAAFNNRWIVYNDSTVIGTKPSADTWWDTTLITKINLSTWYVEYTLTSPISFSTSWTLTSAQLTNILTYKNVWVYSQRSTSDATIYTVELTVE